MPTKKKRVGFIPRSEVLNIINQLSYESNLSNSKIINILVEEALHNRGVFNNQIAKSNLNIGNKEILNSKDVLGNNIKGYNNGVVNNYSKNENLKNQEFFGGTLNLEIYQKFLMFLQFEEEMKKKNR